MRNIDKYKKDLDNLVDLGHRLLAAMYLEVSPKEAKDSLKSQLKDEYDEYLKKVPDFRIGPMNYRSADFLKFWG